MLVSPSCLLGAPRYWGRAPLPISGVLPTRCREQLFGLELRFWRKGYHLSPTACVIQSGHMLSTILFPCFDLVVLNPSFHRVTAGVSGSQVMMWGSITLGFQGRLRRVWNMGGTWLQTPQPRSTFVVASQDPTSAPHSKCSVSYFRNV